MALTKLRKQRRHTKPLSDKQRAFATEYARCRNATKAAIAAGFSKRRANVTGTELLRNPAIAAEIGRLEYEIRRDVKLEVRHVLEQLFYCLTRVGSDFVDESGKLIPIHDLPARANAAIDGIEQDVHTWIDQDGNQHETVKTKLKLVSKSAAIEQAMKHKGLFAPEKIEVEGKVTINFDELIKVPPRPVNVIDTTAVVEEAEATPKLEYNVDDLAEVSDVAE